MIQRWFEIVLPVTPDLVDEAAALLDHAGFGGVEVRERGDETAVVVVFSTEGDASRRVDAACEAVAILGAGAPTLTELDEKVWTENWKHHFARRTFAGRIEVRPPWEAAPPAASGLLPIVINPGMAFGTGLHETTAGCLELLVAEVRPGMTVADVGCGSGILAIAAARLGAAAVLATDIDPLAIDATRENAQANEVTDIVRAELETDAAEVSQWESQRQPGPGTPLVASGTSSGLSAHGSATYDLVVANILAETLVEMCVPLTSAVKVGGVLILSGIEARRLKMVEEAFIRSPWTRARTLAMGEWVTLSLHREVLAEQEQAPSVTPR